MSALANVMPCTKTTYLVVVILHGRMPLIDVSGFGNHEDEARIWHVFADMDCCQDGGERLVAVARTS